MPNLSARMPVGGTLGRRSRFLHQTEFLDGPDELGRTVARTGEVWTVSRGGTVGSATAMDGNGIYSSVASHQPRRHCVYDAASGLWKPRGLLAENTSQNIALGSNLFGDATYWGNAGPLTLAAAPSCIRGQTATLHTCASIGSSARFQSGLGTFVNAQVDVFWAIIEPVTATSCLLSIYDSTAPGYVHEARFTYASMTTAQTAGAGGGRGIIALGNNRYLVWLTGTGTAAGVGANGNSRRAYIYPTDATVTTLSAIIHHAQFEPNRAFPSSPIVTVGAGVTRAAETVICTLPFLSALTDFTALLDVLVPAGTNGTYDNLLGLGGTSNGAEIWLSNTGNAVHAEIRGTPNAFAVGQAYTPGTLLRVAAQFRNWGSGPSCAFDAGSGLGAWSAASDARTALASNTITLNGGSNGPGCAVYQGLRIALGLQTRAYMMAG